MLAVSPIFVSAASPASFRSYWRWGWGFVLVLSKGEHLELAQIFTCWMPLVKTVSVA